MLKYKRSGNGPAVLLIHGFFGGPNYWLPLFNHLTPNFDVIAPTLPGFADSKTDQPLDNIDAFTECLVNFMASLGVERYSVVGHSMGGFMAQKMAVNYSDRLERLVIYGSASRSNKKFRFEPPEVTLKRLQEGDLDGVAEDTTAAWFVEGRESPHFDFCLQCGKGITANVALAAAKAASTFNFGEQIALINLPTLVIGGDQERSFEPEAMFDLASKITDAAFCMIPGTSHCAHLEKPEIFNQIVAEFLLEGR